MRLRTLALALSTIMMGSIMALRFNIFKWDVLLWASLTTLFLQIMSNMANDYGDALSGADNDHRVGPQRMIQQGVISLSAMKKAIIFCIILSLISGIILLLKAFDGLQWAHLIFLLLGLSAIGAAIKYTVGKNPYGYKGLGDIFVFIFFGIIGVAGTWVLHTNCWDWTVLLPASSIGFFSTAVLNLNNIRDYNADKISNKNTMVVRIGRKKASWYHLLLILAGWISIMVYILFFNELYFFWPVLITLPLFIKNIITVFKNKGAQELDNELRNLSLSILLFVLLSGVKIYL